MTPVVATVRNDADAHEALELMRAHGVRRLVVTAANGDETTIEFNNQTESAAPSQAQCRWFYLQPQASCAAFAANQ